MKSINTVILLSAIYLALAPVVYATDSAGTIGLDKQPTYSAMTSAGLKFTNPGMNLLSSAVKVTLEGDFTTIDLLSDGSTVHLSRIANFWAEFGAESLQREGKYYPPQPPVGDDSKVSSFNIGLGKLSIEETQKIFSDLAKILKLDESKVLPWFSNRMWEAAPEGKASLSCSVTRRNKNGENGT